MLGRRVADVFGVLANVGYFEKKLYNGAEAYVLPHPSGVNRWWNDPKNMHTAMVFMRWITEKRSTILCPYCGQLIYVKDGRAQSHLDFYPER
jgi:hypothetical protein